MVGIQHSCGSESDSESSGSKRQRGGESDDSERESDGESEQDEAEAELGHPRTGTRKSTGGHTTRHRVVVPASPAAFRGGVQGGEQARINVRT